MKRCESINTRNLRRIVWFAIILVVFIIPYGKAEYNTARYGGIFAERYKDIGYISGECRFKVMEYDGERAMVYYVPKDRSVGVRVRFKNIGGEWQFSGWDCVWSKTGAADEMIWPLYLL